MTTRLSYSLERSEFVAALQAVVGGIMSTEMHRRWALRLRYYTYFYYIFLVIAGFLLVLLFPTMAEGVIVFGMVVLIANIIFKFAVDRLEAAQLGATFDRRRHHGVVADFGPDRASHIGQEHEQSWQWSLLQRFHELPSVYVLEFAGFDMLVVPRRAFSSGAQAMRWATEIRARLAGNPPVERLG
jgi:hypothetical protein